MNRMIRRQVMERSGGRCELCGAVAGELHHIISGRGKRKQYERVETCIMLCHRCHNHSKIENMITLKMRLQSYYFRQGYNEEQVRVLMGGKLYLQNGEVAKGLRCPWLERGIGK